jgi:hypothetical protein
MHVPAERLVDVAEGTRSPEEEPHLATCDACRRQVDDLRTMMSIGREVYVPEPSPLFWDHFSARVSDAIAADRRSPTAPAPWWKPWLVLVPASALVVLAIAIGVVSRQPGRPAAVSAPVALGPSGPGTPPSSPESRIELLSDADRGDDPSLMLVADLTAEMDWEGVAESGLAPDGSADHAVTHLSGDELLELRLLLQRELRAKAPGVS